MKASKKIFSLVLGTSMFFTGMPECFAMMASAGQDPTQPLSTDAPSEEAADDSSGLGSPAPAPAPEPSDLPDMTDVDLSELFGDVPTSTGNSSIPGTPASPLADSAAHDAEPEVRRDVPLSDGTLSRSASRGSSSDEGETSGEESESEYGSAPASRSSSRLSDDDGETSDDESESERSSAASSRSVSPDISSDEGETSDDEREEEDVAPPAPLLPPVALGEIAETVHIPAPGTGKSSFFAKTVDVAVVAHPSLSRNVVTNFISRVWNPTAGKCTVNGTKRKVKFDLIGSDNLNSLKNYRVIIYSLGSGVEQWRSAEDSFLRDIQPINSRANVIFVSVNGDALAPDVVRNMSDRAAELTTADRKVAYATDAGTNMNPTFGFLPFIVRHFDEADPNFSSWTPSQITGAKRGGIAAACVGGAWIAMNKIFKKPNPKKLKKQHKEDKKSEQNQIANV